ncbi:LamG-like jellyroll fold domain-containing protein [Thalassobellus citreus]|uniref:LamG-like jellyroll fold domain-containing protein n=1 Tax=Thalassobellus citreus TaxID=3367752 RepID=UPI0037A56F05
MRRSMPSSLAQFLVFVSFLLISFFGNSQIIQVEILGGAVVYQGSTVTINAGSSIDFRITNIDGSSCKGNRKVKVRDIDIDNTADFDITPNNPKKNIKQATCWGNSYSKRLDFNIENTRYDCATVSTLVTIEMRNLPDFTFTVEVNSAPEIYVLGGDPWEEVDHNSGTTTDSNGTYFGVVEEGTVITRRFLVANIGSCDMNILSATSNNADFVATSSLFGIPYNDLEPYRGIYIDVTFTAPIAGTGTQSATISISTNDPDIDPFLLNVSAEMFNENIPGPGGITSSFKLWLKSTRGIVTSGSALTDWLDLGTNGKNATTVVGKEPTFVDDELENINFNPVVKFENDGASIEQYMYNNTSPISGFYNHDIFIVMVPEATMTSASTRNTIFAGIDSGNAGDITGVGFGNYSSEFTGETLSYNQDVDGGGSFNGDAVIGSSYANAGIINVRNNLAVSPTAQEILYNSDVLATTNVTDVAFTNISGSEYWLGKNFDIQGSLNGRVAEVFTFSERLTDADRQKVESYLGIKYGITLGASTEAEKDYINSFDTSVWDISADAAAFNHHIAGIGRDSISDLNQKQSKTINTTGEVTIGLGGIYTTNTINPNEFKADGDFLVWGCNNAPYTGVNTNTVTIATGITTTLTRIDRKWKIVESIESGSGGDIETVFMSIPVTVFNSFPKLASEEYALIVADNPNFADGDIIDVIPLVLTEDDYGDFHLKTWYDFDDTNYFTFGKVSNLSENHSMNLTSGDFLVGGSDLRFNVDSFSISAWIKCAANASDRTIMAKGEKFQVRLNGTGNVEVYFDNIVTPVFTSTMDVDDGKWHNMACVYNSGSLLMYIDGVLDHVVQDIVNPYIRGRDNFSIGAVYNDKNSITNPLMGEIDEVCIWGVGLTESQVRYLMNQEIERFDDGGYDYIRGKILPQAASSNEITNIEWGNLKVYYNFNSFYGSTAKWLAYNLDDDIDEPYFLRLNYLNKNKQVVDYQTAPLPYKSANAGDWDTATTWSDNADQVIPNSLSLDGTTIIDWNIVEISHDIDSGDRDISLLGLIQAAGTLTMADPVVTIPVENNAGQALTISHYLELDGVIDLVGESQLIQTEGSIIDEDSGGYIERDQQGTANGFNYNYWSSSVGPIGGNVATRGTGISSTNANHTLADVIKNGTDSDGYADLNFDASPSGGTTPPPGLSRTISTYWLYKFYGAADNYYAWAKIDESSSILPGEGFTMKGTSGSVPITDMQNYVFRGLPNNGDITLALDKTSGEVERLIGNPYPSAIDATEFILDNMSVADGGNNTTGTVFNGALYFWDHFGEQNSHNLADYVGGYATRNLIGGAAAISNDSRINNTSDGGSAAIGTKVPGEYISVNQGFFVSTVLGGFDNDNGVAISTVDGGDIVFKNSQRVYATEDGTNSLFLKSPNKKASKSNIGKKDNTPTIKLLYSSPLGYHRQIVLGENKNATVNFDMGYDAFMVDVAVEDMYWELNKSKLVIQGVNRFNSPQEFPLGIIVKKAGLASVKVETIENIDTDTSIFIKDKLTEEIFKVNNTAFDVFLEPGIYEDRFVLVFQYATDNKSLNVEESVNDEIDNVIVYYDNKVSRVEVINKNDLNILNVSIHNVLGQRVKYVESNSTSNISIPVNESKGTYFVNIHAVEGMFTKKIILN